MNTIRVAEKRPPYKNHMNPLCMWNTSGVDTYGVSMDQAIATSCRYILESMLTGNW